MGLYNSYPERFNVGDTSLMLASNTACNPNYIHIQHIHREAFIHGINSYKMQVKYAFPSPELCVYNLILQFESKRLKLGCVYLYVDYIYKNSLSKSKRQSCRRECFNERLLA